MKWVDCGGGIWELGDHGCLASIVRRLPPEGRSVWCFHVYVAQRWVDTPSTFEQAKAVAESYLPELMQIALLEELSDDT
jgi:hypothetical protein